MSKESEGSNSLIGLFLTKRKSSDMPKRGISLPRIDYEAIQKAAGRRDEFRRKRDEIEYPLFKAHLEAMGVTKDLWANIGKQEDALFSTYLDEVVTRQLPLTSTELPEQGLCREVTRVECQQKVCVDHPVPFDVDEYWLESDGNVTAQTGPTFNGNHADFNARVEGSSYRDWGMYHRRTKESYGAIVLRASTVLVETARVRQVGVTFSGRQSSSGGMANGLYLDGQIFLTVPNSYADGKQTSTFQVSIEPPLGGSLTSYVPSSESSWVFNDPPAAEQNYADPYLEGGVYSVVPPSRSLDLYQVYPAGTFFLIEVRLSHWIFARGKESFGSVWHNFDAQPYINLEACSWVWPKQPPSMTPHRRRASGGAGL